MIRDENAMQHYGVKGMRWGKRAGGGNPGKPPATAKAKKAISSTMKKIGSQEFKQAAAKNVRTAGRAAAFAVLTMNVYRVGDSARSRGLPVNRR